MMRHFQTVLLALLSLGFLGAMIGLPLWTMLHYDEQVSLWREVLSDDYYQRRLQWTMTQAGITALLTTILALPIAWTLARIHFLGRHLILRLLMLPFIMPTLVAGMGVLALFGEHGLLWQGWQETPFLLIYGNIFFNLPVAVLALYQGFRCVPTNRLAMAQTLGANAWQRFIWVEYPMLKSWAVGAICLIFLYCFSGFGLALLLGGQRYATVEVEIYQLIAYELDMSRASVLVWLMLAITALAGSVYALLSKRNDRANVHPSLPMPPEHWGQWMMLLGTFALLIIFCVLPLLAVAVQSLRAFSAWTILTDSETWLAIGNTLRFTGMALVLAVILGIAHASLARRWAWIRGITFLPFMVSPVCLAFGVLLVYPDWSASLPLLIALYALIAYPFITKDLLAAWDTLPAQYTQIAQVSGATPMQIAYWVILPLLLPALKRGLTFAAATGIGEFAATLFLSRPEWMTLTTLIYQKLGKVGLANHQQAMVLTLVLMLLAMSVFLSLDTKEEKTLH